MSDEEYDRTNVNRNNWNEYILFSLLMAVVFE